MKSKVLAIISQKGGSGKTTLSVHLAVCAIRHKLHVAIIDLDPQGSAIDWFNTRQSTNELAAIQASPEQLDTLLKQAKKGGADLIIIDTAPHSDKAAATAASLSDFVLIPCRPSRFDLKAAKSTLDITKLSKTPASVIMNAAPRGKLAENASKALQQQGLNVLDIVIQQRASFSHAVTDGRSVHEYEPDGKAAEEIDKLFSIISKVLNL